MAGKPTRKQPPTGKRIDLRPTRKTILKPSEGVTEIVITPHRESGKLHIRVEGVAEIDHVCLDDEADFSA